jgi:hypothetical protein
VGVTVKDGAFHLLPAASLHLSGTDGTVIAGRMHTPSSRIIRTLSASLITLCLLLTAGIAAAGESFAGKWNGNYANSTGERGNDSLTLAEGPDGHISGMWTGTIPIRGQRTGSNSARFTAGTAKRAYQLTATLFDGLLVVKYTATRLDSSGTYKGESRFRR